jgi:hypothetical protein
MSPFIMHKHMPSMVYCLVPSGVWVTVEILMLRSLRLGLSSPTSPWRYESSVVLDRDLSVLLPWSRQGSVMSHHVDVAR